MPTHTHTPSHSIPDAESTAAAFFDPSTHATVEQIDAAITATFLEPVRDLLHTTDTRPTNLFPEQVFFYYTYEKDTPHTGIPAIYSVPTSPFRTRDALYAKVRKDLKLAPAIFAYTQISEARMIVSSSVPTTVTDYGIPTTPLSDLHSILNKDKAVADCPNHIEIVICTTHFRSGPQLTNIYVLTRATPHDENSPLLTMERNPDLSLAISAHAEHGEAVNFFTPPTSAADAYHLHEILKQRPSTH